MATTWQGVNVNTGAVELPKFNATGVTEEIYIAAVGTTMGANDVILGPVIEAGLFVVNVKAAPDALDSAVSGALTFEVGYINNGTTTAAGFISSGQTVAQAGGIVTMNVPAAYGISFTNNVTVAAKIQNAAGTAMAGNFRLGCSVTASP